MFSLAKLFPDVPPLKVVDVGASPIDGDPPYKPLHDAGVAHVVGFEPATEQYEALLALNLPNATFLPDAVGDGSDGVLHICKAPGMTSMLEPNFDVLSRFHRFDTWAEVTSLEPMSTVRLDDVPETLGMDYLKVDVQGGELPVFRGARDRLEAAVMVHTEVQFVPFYKDQPLFAELDQELREAGYWLHRFLPLISRVLKPMIVNDDPYAGLSQHLWTDAVYVKRFIDFPDFPTSELLKIALLAHDLYGSFDLAGLALKSVDERDGSARHASYMTQLVQSLT